MKRQGHPGRHDRRHNSSLHLHLAHLEVISHPLYHTSLQLTASTTSLQAEGVLNNYVTLLAYVQNITGSRYSAFMCVDKLCTANMYTQNVQIPER